jgi:hypothetical protein
MSNDRLANDIAGGAVSPLAFNKIPESLRKNNLNLPVYR